MTGAQLARQILGHRRIAGISVDRGNPNRYDVKQRRVYLTQEVFDGRDVAALAIASHEVAHSLQHSRMGAAWLVLLSRVEPINLLIERAAWTRARQLFRDELAPTMLQRAQFDSTAASCLRGDMRRALWHVAGLVGVLALAFALRW